MHFEMAASGHLINLFTGYERRNEIINTKNVEAKPIFNGVYQNTNKDTTVYTKHVQWFQGFPRAETLIKFHVS